MMNKFKSALALLLAILLLALAGCGSYTGGNQGGNQGTGGGQGQGGGNGGTGTQDPDAPFSARVIFDGGYVDPNTLNPSDPTPDELEKIKEIKVIWKNEFNYYEGKFDENGVAVPRDQNGEIIELDGDYRVTLSALPIGYSYNPNIYKATNNSKETIIQIYDYKTTRGTGANRYDKSIKLSKIGLYKATLEDKDDIVYFQFEPKESGTYAIESWVDISANNVNPILDVYRGQPQISYFAFSKDDGAEGEQGTFTTNFRYEISIAPDEIGNALIFGVRADVTAFDQEEIDISFVITLNGSPDPKGNSSSMMVPYELLNLLYDKLTMLQAMTKEEFDAFIIAEVGASAGIGEYETLKGLVFPELKISYDEDGNEIKEYTRNHKNLYDIIENKEINEVKLNRVSMYLHGLFEQSGTYHGAESDILGAEGRKLFDQEMYQICPDDGFYHLFDPVKYASTNGYGPILYADVATGGRFLDSALISIEYAGNKALTVDGSKNYKHFLEGYTSLITPRGAYPNIIGAYYCVYLGEGHPGEVNNCPCIEKSDCDRACLDGCKDCTDECRAIVPNLYYAVGYGDLANSDGRVPVTKELKDFLQSFSVSQRYFADGNGWVETNPTYSVDAPEDSQWLWACGYYE